MVFDTIENSGLYKNISPLIEKAFKYIKNTDFNKLDLGKHIIDGDSLFALLMEYDTKDISDCKLEAHQKYIDIQYILSGSELIGVTSLINQLPTINYDKNNDIVFYDNNASSMFKLETGHFAIFFPKDMHMPCLKTNEKAEKVKKVVIKIKV